MACISLVGRESILKEMPHLVASTLAILGQLAALFGGCSRVRDRERILFSTIGTHPFQDYVFSIRPSGRDLRAVLKPESNRSYTFASAHSSSGPILVTVHELAPGNDKVEDHLYLYSPNVDKWQRVLPGSAPQGPGILSPDGNSAVYSARKLGSPPETSLRVVDLRNGESRELVAGDGAMGLYPCWGVLGRVAFIRTFRSANGLLTELLDMPSQGGEQTVLVPAKDGAISAAYSPDGREVVVWMKEGLEIVALDSGDRRVVLKRAAIGLDYFFRSWGIGGLAWSEERKIAFSVVKKKTTKSELWIVNADGTNPKRIYATTAGRILVSQFIQ